MSTRSVFILAGLVVAYFATYGGDGLYALSAADLLSHDKRYGFLIVSVFLGVSMIVIGGITWVLAIWTFLGKENEEPDEVAVCAVTAFICLSCLFGILAGPFANYGANPLYWLSRWSWLPILAFVPLILVIRDAFTSMSEARRERKNQKNNIVPLRRDSA